MTVFESLINKNIDEFAEWLDKYCNFDFAPWWQWWDDNYCNKCESVIFSDDEGSKEEFAYCEHYGNCRFFKEMEDTPDNKQIIKMWLESECNRGKDI